MLYHVCITVSVEQRDLLNCAMTSTDSREIVTGTALRKKAGSMAASFSGWQRWVFQNYIRRQLSLVSHVQPFRGAGDTRQGEKQ